MKKHALHVGIVAVPMPMIVAMVMMSVPVSMSVVERENANHVDHKTHETDQQQPMGVHLWRVQQSLNGLNDDKDGDQAQKDTVGES